MAAKGATYKEIVREVGCAESSVTRVLVPLGGVIRREMWDSTGVRLSA
jgi:hypothetical protein